ncbi:DNA repair protein RAD51 homolog 4 [Cephus cinctus]|uniref:DNA repair protein RAD51 homolog 4 n=1 Tax=Cephus cinctus TaxID=211228 RepID=A0AAJ7RKP6_CEPCN|nr:DNA repair protein RAD51 homolog 4 [Cephus cinctus]XP_015599095.1 DNA repair protein RAD51 homolog 4 [Cephus cinctus]XP_015599096.1 DNA repair protein RAD51 homolog 4 [Cephus cinctus]XP_015599097.1 DNA repair protein RAD51 homolog 4 [Cephus cinctus]XP_015599098.1 DNA repair protein RAD51 homolog 4 [Cephus cinctus]XP_024942673.1 DNA repair protein RAD51 homolog 4 [Cephus cinctus]
MARLDSSMHPKLTDEIVLRLQAKKIFTVFNFMSEHPDKLIKITDFSYKEVLEFKKTIAKSFSGQVQDAFELMKIEYTNIVPSGITSLDDLLKGGLHPGHLYEICGVSSSGKTQLCHTVAANITSSTKSYVHYIDTKRDFSALRIQRILEAKKYSDAEIGEAMDRIKVTRVKNVCELFNILYHLNSSLKTSNDSYPTKLVIIDSVAAIFLQLPTVQEMASALNNLSNISRCLANSFHIPLITVNLISRWREVDGFAASNENPIVIKPSLGKYWLHVPNTRLMIQKEEKEFRKISVWKSFQLKLNSFCIVNITTAGVI